MVEPRRRVRRSRSRKVGYEERIRKKKPESATQAMELRDASNGRLCLHPASQVHRAPSRQLLAATNREKIPFHRKWRLRRLRLGLYVCR